MNYTQEFNQEYDRMFYLITMTCDYRFGRLYNEPNYKFIVSIESFSDLNFYKKIEVLHKLFTAKNKNGEWVLEAGSDETKQYKDNNFLFKSIKKRTLSGEIKDFSLCATLECLVDLTPTTLRDLFLANCIPSNDPEQDKIKIENLKLIKW